MSNASIKSKIAALRAKTKANGCTEAEALSAAEMAARLMREHGIDETEIEMTATVASEIMLRAWQIQLGRIIARCVDCRCVEDQRFGTLTFVGRSPGPEIALYLRDICFRSVQAEVDCFKLEELYRRTLASRLKRRMLVDFADGMASRLGLRLDDLFRPETAKVVRAKVDQSESSPSLRRSRRPYIRDALYGSASDAGWDAGGGVALNHGVAGGQGAPTARIGR